MKSRTAPTPPDLDALYDRTLGLLGGPTEVETPQLGRVQFPRPNELWAALNYLKLAAAGTAAVGVVVISHDRGLWPCKGCC